MILIFESLIAGRGLVLLEERKKGQFIGEYAGEWLDYNEGLQREHTQPSLFCFLLQHLQRRWW